MSLNTRQQTEVIRQAVNDAASGKFTEYKGDTLADVVFAAVDAITNTPSTHEVATEKQELYNRVRSRGC